MNKEKENKKKISSRESISGDSDKSTSKSSNN
jgi:hypothetical protein